MLDKNVCLRCYKEKFGDGEGKPDNKGFIRIDGLFALQNLEKDWNMGEFYCPYNSCNYPHFHIKDALKNMSIDDKPSRDCPYRLEYILKGE